MRFQSRRIVVNTRVLAGLSVLSLSALLIATSSAFAADPDISEGLNGSGLATEGVATEADAARFRETFGLAKDLGLIRAAALDSVNYSSAEYGVPLSKAEVAELLRRAEVQAAVDPAAAFAATDPSYAGMYLDQLAGGRPVFLFTGDPDARAAGIAAQLPSGTAFEVAQAERTEAQLLETQARIDASWDTLATEGIEIVLTGIQTDRNAVVVGVRGLTEAASARLHEEFGPGLIIREDDPAQADACLNTNECRPMKGGIAINSSFDGGKCTSGFVVKRLDTGQLNILTAGHCLDVHGGWDVVWRHDSIGFGKSRRDTWVNGGAENADVGLVYIYSGETPSLKNQIHTGSGTIRTVTGWDSAQYVGDQSCRYGRTTFLDCGIINAVGVKRKSEVGTKSMDVLRTNQVSFDSRGGDSGGSMFFYAPGGTSYVIAQGTHVHSGDDDDPNAYGWFSPVSWGRTTYNGMFGYDYSICTNSACT